MISSVDVLDEYTLQMTTDYPFAPLLSHLAHPAGAIISPKSIDADYAAMEEGKTSGSVISEHPIGTGYFKFKNWVPGTEIVLEKNENYWGEPAHLNTVTFKVVPDSGTRIAELETGYAHIIEPVQPTESLKLMVRIKAMLTLILPHHSHTLDLMSIKSHLTMSVFDKQFLCS